MGEPGDRARAGAPADAARTGEPADAARASEPGGGGRPLLGFDRAGSGPALVLIHSLGADRCVWHPVLDRLARQRDVIALDLPGFGESAPLPSGTEPTPAALAAAIHRACEQLGVDRPHVAGNSLGGWVALELAAAGHAASVTAIAPAGLWSRALGPKPSIARGIARAAAPVLARALSTERGRRLALGATMAHPERVPPQDALRLVRAYAAAPGYDTVNAAMRAGRFQGLDRIDVPLTFGWPDRDRLIARPHALPTAARNVVLEGCGHVPMWDDPDQVADLLLAGSVNRRAAA
jgi:pimeloyl-ACP methyl ester carboxylesterase